MAANSEHRRYDYGDIASVCVVGEFQGCEMMVVGDEALEEVFDVLFMLDDRVA